jgi:hypothetical protein
VDWATREHYDAPVPKTPLLCAAFAALAVACDKEPAKAELPEAAPAAVTATASAPPDPPRAPDIVVDPGNVAIGNDRVATGELGLADKVAVFLNGRPMIAGATVSLVAMRNSKPSQVAAVVTALRKAKAAGAIIRTDGRDGVTGKLPVEFTSTATDCATVAWIAKDGSIVVWPAGGGAAHKAIRGLAGPDMTLGTDAVRKQQSSCNASELFVGADDAFTWGLVFDLATMSLAAPGSHLSSGVLVSNPSIGRKLTFDP